MPRMAYLKTLALVSYLVNTVQSRAVQPGIPHVLCSVQIECIEEDETRRSPRCIPYPPFLIDFRFWRPGYP